MERTLFLRKIDINTLYLQNICKDNILFKITCKGIKFLKINKVDVINPSTLNKLQISNIFNCFTNPMYETLLHDCHTKIYLDLDFKNLSLDFYNNKNDIFLKFNKYFIDFLNNKKINYKNIIYSDASRKINDKYKLSLHVVVNGVAFKNRIILRKLIVEFKNTLINDKLFYNSIDTGIYGVPQLFKCVLSPSKDDRTLLIPFLIENDNITIIENNVVTDNLLNYLVGVYNENEEITYLDDVFNYLLLEDNISVTKSKKTSVTNNVPTETKNIPENTRKWIENNFHIKGIYKLRSNHMYNNKINLDRIRIAHCNICDRTHDSENAYCTVTENNIIFYCGRNENGKVIGSWYKADYKQNSCKFFKSGNCHRGNTCKFLHEDNKEGIENNADNATNNLLKNNKELIKTINNLRKYINELENKYNETVNKLTRLSQDKCENINSEGINKKKYIKKYTKEKYDGLWNKYYLLGKSIEENIDELYNNIICSWKDSCIGRLKGRGVRVYQYLNKFNGNTKGYSLRNLFHMKSFEFSQILHTP
jgi:hypothetical protein